MAKVVQAFPESCIVYLLFIVKKSVYCNNIGILLELVWMMKNICRSLQNCFRTNLSGAVDQQRGDNNVEDAKYQKYCYHHCEN